MNPNARTALSCASTQDAGHHMGWVGPNGRIYQNKRWVVFAAIGAAAAALAGWIRNRLPQSRGPGGAG